MLNRENILQIYPLAPMQEGIYFHYLLDPSSPAYLEQSTFRIQGTLSRELLQKSLHILAHRHDVLRTVFVQKNEHRPLQILLREVEIPLEFEDLRGNLDQQTYVAECRQRDREAGFDLRTELSMRLLVLQLDDEHFEIIWTHHHIIMDGWCLGFLVTEFQYIYKCLGEGVVPQLPNLRPYRQYIDWISKRDKTESIKFWKNYLEGSDEVTPVPATVSDPRPYVQAEATISFGAGLTGDLNDLAAAARTTLNTILQTGWGILLSKYNDCRDVVFGGVVSGRPHQLDGVEKMIGLFINTIPVRVRYDAASTTMSLLQKQQEAAANATSHHYISLPEIHETVGRPFGVFDHILNFVNYLRTPTSDQPAGGGSGRFERTGTFEQTNYEFYILMSPGPEIEARVFYNRERFAPAHVAGILKGFVGMLQQMVADPLTTIDELGSCAAETAASVMKFGNPSAKKWEHDHILKAFWENAHRVPNRIALEVDGTTLTYQELDERSNQIAHFLTVEHGLQAGDKVGVLLGRGLRLIPTLLGIMKAGAAYVPLDPRYPAPRISYMISNSRLRLLVTESEKCAPEDYPSVTTLLLDSLEAAIEEQPRVAVEVDPNPGALIYVMYTSGSTGKPKGVCIRHLSIANFLNNIAEEPGFSREDVMVARTTFSFDISILDLFLPLFCGGKLVLATDDQSQDPKAIMALLESSSATMVQATPSFWTLVMQEGWTGRDTLKMLSVGEALNRAIGARMLHLAGELWDMYGPTEASVYATLKQKRSPEDLKSIGAPMRNARIFVLDQNRKLQPPEIEGEIYIGGQGLATGYLGMETMTAERFVPSPFHPGERIYRTGDRGKWSANGELMFIGRKDEQVKVRGYRIELGEVRTVLLNFPGIANAAVLVAGKTETGKNLIAYYEAGEELNTEKLAAFLLENLPRYMVPTNFIWLRAIPISPAGKVDLVRLGEMVADHKQQGEDYIAPETDMERQIASIWERILGVDAPGLHDNFFRLGGHSFKAIQVLSLIRKELKLELQLKDIFEYPTISLLLDAVPGRSDRRQEPIPNAKPQPRYPASHAQQRLWVIGELAGGNAAYNMPGAFQLNTTVVPDTLRKAMRQLSQRHEILRTTFQREAARVFQVIHPAGKLLASLEYTDLTAVADPEAAAQKIATEEAQSPFDLVNGPLWRVHLLAIEPERTILLFTVHHIIADIWSMSILFGELQQLYLAIQEDKALTLPELPLQYKDFSIWQLEQLREGGQDGLRTWWHKQLASPLTLLDLPADAPRGKDASFEGEIYDFALEASVFEALTAYCAAQQMSQFMVLLAAFKALLYRYTGEQDILVGTPVDGRVHPDLKQQIGFYVNMLALRDEVKPETSFSELTSQIKRTVLDAYERQNYPIDLLVEELDFDRLPGRNPLIDIVFLQFDQAPVSESGQVLEQLTAAQLARWEIKGNTSNKFDFTFGFSSGPEGITFSINYAAGRYGNARIQRMTEHFVNLLRTSLEKPALPVSKAEMLTLADTKRLEKLGNHFPSPVVEQSLPDRFRETAARYSGHTAMVFAGQAWTYAELDVLSDQWAATLIQRLRGEFGKVIAVHAERSAHAIIAFWAILKSGNIYLPLAPELPLARKRFMLQDCSVGLILTGDTSELPEEFQHHCLGWEQLGGNVEKYPGPKADAPAALIYTSGTTGRPKGVLLAHAGFVALATEQIARFGVREGDHVLQFAALSFDASISEILMTLLAGGTLYPVPKITVADPEKFVHFLDHHQIQVATLPPAYLRMLKGKMGAEMRVLITAGEAARTEDAAYFADKLAFFNAYGPTETSVCLTTQRVQPHEDYANGIPVGQPLGHVSLHLLDADMNPVPAGATGEIWAGGPALALEYLNQPDLTAARFVNLPGQAWSRVFRVGDLGRWRSDGSLEFVGRKDRQVKIRGHRVELTGIEHQLRQHPEVKEAVCRIWSAAGREPMLLAYVQAGAQLKEAEVQGFLRKALPEYMLPSQIIFQETFPLTPHGKIDVRALPLPGEVRTELQTPLRTPGNDVEAKIHGIWAELLQRPAIGVDQNFFSMGGNSLLAIHMLSQVNAEFVRNLGFQQIYENPTIESLAELVATSGKYQEVIPKAKRERYMPVSHAQRRMWILHHIDGASAAYNIGAVVQLSEDTEVAVLVTAFEQLVDRYEVLRTRFVYREEDVYQEILPDHQASGFEVACIQLPAGSDPKDLRAQFTQQSNTAFDLATCPLLRVRIYALATGEIYLGLTIHHIISDGWSMGVLLREVLSLYQALVNGETDASPPLQLQYADYASWQNQNLVGEKLDSHRDFWKAIFAERIPVLEVPADFSHPPARSYQGGNAYWKFTAEQAKGLTEIGAQHGSSLFVSLLALVNAFIGRYASGEDIVIGTPVAGRGHKGLDDQIGLFINTIAIRNRFTADESFSQFLQKVQQRTAAAMAHQDYPFDLLLQELELPRNARRNPIFDIFLTLEERELVGGTGPSGSNLLKSVEDHGYTASKFDLSFGFSWSGDALLLKLEYNTDIFLPSRMEAMVAGLAYLLDQILLNADQPLSNFSLVPPEIQTKLLLEFGRTEATRNSGLGVLELIAENAARQPSSIAIYYEDASWTYGDLNALANQVANFLTQDYGVGTGVRVGIYVQRTPEMLASMLGILKTGACFIPLDPAYPIGRVQYALRNGQAGLLITDAGPNIGETAEGTQVILMSDMLAELADRSTHWSEKAISISAAAYILYTSGSTGYPKGVVMSHGNLRFLVQWARGEFGENHGSARFDLLFAGTSCAFDLSIFEIFYPLAAGLPLRLLDSNADISQYLDQHQNILLNTVPSVIKTLQAAAVDFSNVALLNMAGEAIPAAVIAGLRAYPKLEIRNLYGPTEATTYATQYRFQGNESVFPIGRPLAGAEILVVDACDQLCPIGVPGEICIGGPGLAAGYQGQAELTEEKFVDNPFSPGNRMYRTGDLGSWRHDGQLIFLGRRDFQVKLNGYRIELGEIEMVLRQAPQIKDAVVGVIEAASGQLVAWLVHEEAVAPNELRKILRERLPAYMVPEHFVFLPEFPLTPNGKIDRHRLPVPEEDSQRIIDSTPETPTERQLLALWAEVLGTAEINPGKDFFANGGNSLKAVQLVARIYQEKGIRLTLGSVFLHPGLQAQANAIEESAGMQFRRIPRAPEAVDYPMSHAQKRIWTLHKLEGGNVAYNIPLAFEVEGALDASTLAAAVNALVKQHSTLRTVYSAGRAGLRQVVLDSIPVQIEMQNHEVASLKELSPKLVELAGRQVFDLENSAMVRIHHHRFSEGQHLLIFIFHHIAIDGWSFPILLGDLVANYVAGGDDSNAARGDSGLQYKDYAVWEANELSGERAVAHRNYWHEMLGQLASRTSLTPDFARNALQEFDGAGFLQDIPAPIIDDIRQLRGRQGGTEFGVWLAIVQSFLARYTGQHDVLIGIPVSGREHPDVQSLVGMFVNTLVFRSQVNMEAGFGTFLRTVQDGLQEAFSHSVYPFDLLVEELLGIRDLSRNPFFDIAITWESAMSDADSQNSARGLDFKVRPLPITRNFSKFDLHFIFVRYSGHLSLEIAYNTSLYRKERIEGIGAGLMAFAAQAAEFPERPLRLLPRLSDAECNLLLNDFNAEELSGLSDSNILEMLATQVARTPEQPALLFNKWKYTYQELHERSNQVAHCLRAQFRIEEGARIVLLLGRSEWMLVCILGILKTGGSYVPVDPAYPEARRTAIVDQAGADLLLTENSDWLGETAFPGEICNLSDLLQAAEKAPTTNLQSIIKPENEAYVLFTSGSTGLPKGVVITHQNLSHFLKWSKGEFADTPYTTMLAGTSYCFDLSIFELFHPITTGRSVRILRSNAMLGEYLGKTEGAMVNTVPSLLRKLLEEGKPIGGVVAVNLAGEAYPPELYAQLRMLPGVELRNLYGPTEATTYATCARLEGDLHEIPIGKPVGNSKVYLLDEDMELVPSGMPGELYISGPAVAACYLGAPELSAVAFLPDPFREGRRMYRTGDFAKWRPDGQLLFLGRRDEQVKLRGYRIELDEISGRLSQHPLVAASVMIVSEGNTGGEEKLLACVQASGEKPDPLALKTYLTHHLPAYMVPDVFLVLDSFPLNANGKIDKKELLEMAQLAQGIPKDYVPPKTRKERKLAAIWEEILEVEQIGRFDNFFDLGGTSLQAMQLIAELEASFSIVVPIQTVMLQNLSNLAEILSKR